MYGGHVHYRHGHYRDVAPIKQLIGMMSSKETINKVGVPEVYSRPFVIGVLKRLHSQYGFRMRALFTKLARTRVLFKALRG